MSFDFTKLTKRMPMLYTMPANTPEVAYVASCHCGALRYTIKTPVLYAGLQDHTAASPAQPRRQVVDCNCSGCLKFGILGVYVPRANVEWQQGFPEKIFAYRYATKTIDHMRCTDCMSPIGIDFKGTIFEEDTLSMNARMIYDIDIDKLDCIKSDGKNFINTDFKRDY